MGSVSENNKRIAKNTFYLYIRMILVMGVTLFTSRIILNALGAHEYGLYSVIGGVVALFAIISGSLSSAISRFLTFELGHGDIERLKKVFSASLFIQGIIIVLILLVIVPIAIWFIHYKLNISTELRPAAYWIFGFSIGTFCVNLLSVPYNASIISHEKMYVFSIVSIIDVTCKLGIAYLIKLFSSERVIFYAALLLVNAIIIQSIYMIYCSRHFAECGMKFQMNRQIIKEIGAFAGWNFIGSSSSILRDQGNNIILNIFFGTIVNAAYSISMQVNSAINQLASNFMVAVNPQITKYYSQHHIPEMISLMFRSSRMAFFLTMLLASVLLFNTSYILTLWLKNVPEYTVIFVQLIVVFSLIESISRPMITAMLATGRIRNYQLIVGGLQMVNLPMSYIILKFGGSPVWPLIISIALSVGCLIARLIMLRHLIPFKISSYLKTVIGRIAIVALVSVLLPILIINLNGEATQMTQFILQTILYLAFTALSIYFIGCTTAERMLISEKMISIKRRLI